jgi:GNAT superfamily N-acetyltransferase
MIRQPFLNTPYNPEREKDPDKKLMRLMQHNFKTAGCSLARFGHGGFFSLDHNYWDGLPLDGVVMLRTIYTLPDCRGQGVQRAIISTVTSMAYKTGCAVLAVAHTFEPRATIETERDFVDSYGQEYGDPFEYFGPDSKENRRQNKAFKRAGWQNISVKENIGTPWITSDYCWIMIPDTASPELKQQIKPRLVEPASALG